jgi:hypothetical protein
LSAVFETTTAPLVERLFQGKDSLLFTLGVTGSGKVPLYSFCDTDKTHTVFGETGNPGITPFALKGLFEAIEEQKATVFSHGNHLM